MLFNLTNGKLILVDGGQNSDASLLYDYIMKYGNGKVDDWYITHPHGDHTNALVELLNCDDYQITIENLYYSFNTSQWYQENDPANYEDEMAILQALDNPKIKNKMECVKGQVIKRDNINCEILRVANPEIKKTGNESSMVFKMTATDVNKSILFLGDILSKASQELLENPEKLKADAVQMAHHGQNGATQKLYETIQPQICFFNAPEWLYNNDNGTGYNTGAWQSVIVRGWMEKMNTQNFIAYEGDVTIHFYEDGYEVV